MNDETKCKCHGELDKPIPEWKQIIQLKEENEVLKRAYWLAITTIVNDMGDEAENKDKVMENLIKWYIKQAKKEMSDGKL